jgi:hypothetical protein
LVLLVAKLILVELVAEIGGQLSHALVQGRLGDWLRDLTALIVVEHKGWLLFVLNDVSILFLLGLRIEIELVLVQLTIGYLARIFAVIVSWLIIEVKNTIPVRILLC